MGRKQWLLDDRKCDLSDSKTWLTFTSCNEDQFTCTDGTCIPLIYRCDLKADCLDRSDEENCRKVLYLFSERQKHILNFFTQVIFPGDYEKNLAPKHTENGERVDTALPVYLNIDILSFDKIDTVEMSIG